MTEKRFKEYYQGKTIVSVHDTKNNNELVNILQCVDLLNRIAEENEQLKKRLLEIAYYFRDEVTRRDLDDKDFEELRRLSKIYFDGVD